MARLSLALWIVLCACICAGAQSLRPRDALAVGADPGDRDHQLLQSKALAALARLDRDVIVYRSLADFEAGGRLAQISLVQFESELRDVKGEVAPLLDQIPKGRLKSALENALDSFTDGAFWWSRIEERRVIPVSELISDDLPRAPADRAFISSIPYTVAIHWRQAHEYLKQAQKSVAR